jgi:hypothetical protein
MSNNPTVSQVHVNRPLTNISIAYVQSADNFIADKVFPQVPVSKKGDQYFIYSREDFNRIEAQVRAAGTESAGSGYNLTTDTYLAAVLALHKDIDDQERANSDNPLMPDRDATTYLVNNMLMKRDKDWATAFFGAGIWTTNETGVAAAPAAGQFLQWNNAASTPIEDIQEQIDVIEVLTGFTPNKLVLGKDVWRALQNHPDVVARVVPTQNLGNAKISLAQLAVILEVDEVIVSKAIENTAAEGAAENNARIVNTKAALLVYAAPNPSLMVPSAGYIFTWTGLLGGRALSPTVSKFRMEHLKSDRVETELAYDMKLVSADLGAFFITAVA